MNARSMWMFGIVFGLGLGVVGCGGDDDNNGATSCDASAASYCAAVQACFPFILQASYGTVSQCTKQLATSCELETSARGSNIQPSAYGACLNSISGGSCDELAKVYLGITRRSSCGLPNGDLSDGDACYLDSQCKAGGCSVAHGDCGVCAAPPSEGQPCPDYDCADGLVCTSNPAQAVGTCVKRTSAGGACLLTSECIEGLGCVNGVCAVATRGAKKGESCANGVACDPLLGLSCDSSSVCSPQLIAKAGEACGAVGEQYVICQGGTDCVGDTCVAELKVGAACDGLSSATASCEYPNECVDGVCRAFSPSTCE